MTNVHELVASVLYQDVQIAQNLSFSELSMENAVLEMPEPLPVASEMSVRIAHPDGAVLGAAVVTRVRESRAAGEAGQMHLRWVEFSDGDFARLADWVAAPPGVARPKKPEPVVASEPEPVVASEPEPVVASEPEPVVASEPEPVAPAEPVASIPDGPVAGEDERTLPIDPGATMLDLQAIPEATPGEDTAAHEAGGADTGSAESTGEEISVVDEDGESSGSPSTEDGATKKRRRRTKKK